MNKQAGNNRFDALRMAEESVEETAGTLTRIACTPIIIPSNYRKGPKVFTLGVVVSMWCMASTSHVEPLKVCLVSGSFEYDSDKSLESFKKAAEARYSMQCTLLKATGWDNIPGIEALDSCDVALFFTRRLKISGEQLDKVKKYCMQGKPIVGVRTASHGFQNWLEMDKEVLGGNYKGHYDEGPVMEVKITDKGKQHTVLKGIAPFRSRYSLYKNPDIPPDTDVLLTGSIPEHTEPVAWTRMSHGGRVFYISLGGIEDFQNETFQTLIVNALFWAAGREVVQEAQTEKN